MAKPKPAPDALTLALTVKRFARCVDMSENGVLNLIARGELKALRLGRSVRIPLSEFDRLGLPRPTFGEGDAR